MYDGFGHWHEVYWYHGSWHHMGALFIVIVLLLIISGIVFLIQNSSKFPTERPMGQDSAMGTLKKRYASGEINAEEFVHKKKDLES